MPINSQCGAHSAMTSTAFGVNVAFLQIDFFPSPSILQSVPQNIFLGSCLSAGHGVDRFIAPNVFY